MYLKWGEKVITDFSDTNINSLYNQSYVFTRLGKGKMEQTRSLRIDLKKFELSSENRRVLKKTEALKLEELPLPYAHYHFSIGKLGKDFYETKFGAGTFSANKIKELLTDKTKSNFNILFTYTVSENPESIGYCVALETNEIIHYAYPFYNLQLTTYNLLPNTGLGMMLKAILWAKEQGKKYMYLGSFSRPTDTYKLQFAGLEWWIGQKWETDLGELKNSLQK